MRRAARVDANQAEIVAALRAAGASVWTCAGGCGKTEHRPPSRAILKRCWDCKVKAFKEGKHPHHKKTGMQVCQQCGLSFHSYTKGRKYCSNKCFSLSPKVPRVREPRPITEADMKRTARKDDNHNEIVEALKLHGVSVIDTSSMGGGFPDLICGFAGKTLLMEIKNPKTYYGRKGLNKNQMRWKEAWTGGPYAVVNSVDGVIVAVNALRGGTVATVTDAEGALRVLEAMA